MITLIVAIDSDMMRERILLLWFDAWALEREYAITNDIPRIRAVIEYVSSFLPHIYVLLTPMFFHIMSSGSGAGRNLRSSYFYPYFSRTNLYLWGKKGINLFILSQIESGLYSSNTFFW